MSSLPFEQPTGLETIFNHKIPLGTYLSRYNMSLSPRGEIHFFSWSKLLIKVIILWRRKEWWIELPASGLLTRLLVRQSCKLNLRAAKPRSKITFFFTLRRFWNKAGLKFILFLGEFYRIIYILYIKYIESYNKVHALHLSL